LSLKTTPDSDIVTIAAYRNLPTAYPTVSSPAVPFSHNTNVTDWRQTDGQNIVP